VSSAYSVFSTQYAIRNKQFGESNERTYKQERNELPVVWLVVGNGGGNGRYLHHDGFQLAGCGGFRADERPSGIIYVAAGSYLVGGLLILLRRRWLWVMGAVINALVILFFFSIYQERPAVLLSPGGIISKAAQILLEVGLIYLIVTDWLHSR
jgi:hypothetical protein